ncbi:hypothetical protein FH972_021060 [Carpinus fangiana]|uniref:Uncharacterized protein n=1 Tax=Carpinus fangiana TaxID=176857 RepID=A0A5N6KNB3_9ROSI|nr:hypothetical protein FH972_021060 [Carpinus fangiana]
MKRLRRSKISMRTWVAQDRMKLTDVGMPRLKMKYDETITSLQDRKTLTLSSSRLPWKKQRATLFTHKTIAMQQERNLTS